MIKVDFAKLIKMSKVTAKGEMLLPLIEVKIIKKGMKAMS